MSRKITCIGETILDIVFKDNKPVAAVPGGSTFNAIISLGRTAGRDFKDVAVSMVTDIGDDHVADIVTSFMEANGVDTQNVTRYKNARTNISLAFLDSNSNAHYQFYKDRFDSSQREEKLASITFEKDDLVLFGSYFVINPELRSFVAPLLQRAHEAGAILCYDVNIRRNHLDQMPGIYGNIVENCRVSDIVRGSSEDFEMLLGIKDPEEIYRKYIKALCPIFICTCGPDPVHIFTPDRHITIPVPRIVPVSTIGAGDNFNAGLLYSLLAKDLRKADLATLSSEQLTDIAAIADSFSIEVCCSMDNYVGKNFRAIPDCHRHQEPDTDC